MVHIIGDLGVLPKVSHKTQILCCMKESQQVKNKIYDSEEIQKRINEATKERVRLDSEIKKRYENIKHIKFLG